MMKSSEPIQLCSFSAARRCRIGLLAVVIATLPFVTLGADKPAQGLAPHARIAPVDVDALLHKHGLSGARVGFHAVDQENGGLVTSRAASQFFIPASTVKIVTAAAALGALGPAHRFRTSVHATGELRDGVLNGDLYLKGSGDPLLAVQDLMGMIERLKDQGLGRVAGQFHFDESLLPTVTAIDRDQPAAAPYNSGVSALSLDFNRIRVHWKQTSRGATVANFSPLPGAGTITIGETVGGTSAGPGRPFVPASTTGDNWIMTPAHLPTPDGMTELPVRRAGLRTAEVFRALAKATGTTMAPPSAGSVPKEARELAGVDSVALTQILRPALEYSNNMVSELIGMAAAQKLHGKTDTLAESSEKLVKWLAGRTLDLDLEGLNLPNHSGLSAQARATPKQMLAFLRHGLLMRYGVDGIIPLLPAGGWRDSLGGRFRDPAVAGWVWGKSGTLHYATGLVGVLFGRASGRRTAFALYVMDDKRRAAYDADPNRQSLAVQATAKAWIDKAKAFEEDLVSAWTSKY